MISDEFALSQAERLSALPFFPILDQGRFELARTLRDSTENEQHAKAVIDECVGFDDCPTPATLRSVAARLAPAKPDSSKGCPYCGGTGWIVIERNGLSGASQCSCVTGSLFT